MNEKPKTLSASFPAKILNFLRDWNDDDRHASYIQLTAQANDYFLLQNANHHSTATT